MNVSYVMRQMSPVKPPPPQLVKHDYVLVNAPSDLSVLIHIGTAFMVIVQFRGHLVRQYRACVTGGITCVLYLCTLCVQGILILSPLLFMPSLYPNLLVSSHFL